MVVLGVSQNPLHNAQGTLHAVLDCMSNMTRQVMAACPLLLPLSLKFFAGNSRRVQIDLGQPQSGSAQIDVRLHQ